MNCRGIDSPSAGKATVTGPVARVSISSGPQNRQDGVESVQMTDEVYAVAGIKLNQPASRACKIQCLKYATGNM